MKIDEGKRAHMIYNASIGGSVGADAMRDVLGALDEALVVMVSERAAAEAEIVRYIRAQPDGCNPLAIADRIERGEHRAKK